jgi:hypothetical protein
MIAREIFEPMYRVRVLVIAKCNAAEARKVIIKHLNYDTELDPKAYATLIAYEEGKQFILYLRRSDTDTIAHEASHILDDVYAYRGIAHNCGCASCSEHRAHQTEGWMRLIREAIKV